MWVLDFMQKRFHDTSGDSETKEGLSAEEATGENLHRPAFAHWKVKIAMTEVSQVRDAVSSLESHTERGLWTEIQVISLE